MTYATLIVGRVRLKAIKVVENDEQRFLSEAEAKELYHREIVEPAELRYDKAIQSREVALEKFDESVEVSPNVEVLRDTGGFRKSKVIVDQIVIDGKLHEVAAGYSETFIADERRNRHPLPDKEKNDPFEVWFKRRAVDHRTWKAELITSTKTRNFPTDNVIDDWGYPISLAVTLLNEMENDGWRLVHVSEDHGLYSGMDTTYEAYPSRVRYLLKK